MSRARASLAGVATGVVLFVAGAFGWFGEDSILLLAVPGLLICVIALAMLVSTQSRADLTAPHPSIYVLVAVAVALHGYENMKSGSFSYGWLAWALLPYLLVLALSCFRGTSRACIAGAVVALVLDGLVHYDVFISPKGSTAALALIWAPVWNTLILVPIATSIAALVMRFMPSSPPSQSKR